MLTTEEIIAALRRDMSPLLETVIEGVLTKVGSVLEEARQERAQGLAEVAEEHAKSLVELNEECVKSLGELNERRAELSHEIVRMHMHREAQEGRVELNIGGYRFETSVQTLRRVPHTFFDAYFSGRYAQDVCNDGSIFVDRDGEHFGHVLEYMRDGHLSVAEPGARPSVSLLRMLQREFGFYCIELNIKQAAKSEQPTVTYAIGGQCYEGHLSTMEQYNALTDQWSAATAMVTKRRDFGACVVAGEVYVTGGRNSFSCLSIVEKYSPSSDTWSTVTPLPHRRSQHTAVAVGSSMYVLGGELDADMRQLRREVLRFDSILGIWSEFARVPDSIERLAACAVGDVIYVFGTNEELEDPVNFKLDTLTSEWSTLTTCDKSLIFHRVCALDGIIYVVGAGGNFDDFLRFDPTTEAWAVLAPTTDRRDDCALFVLGESLYAAGGGFNSASVECYDVASDTWAVVSDMLQGRQSFGVVTIGSAGLAEEQDLFDHLIAQASRDSQRA
jgi:hypothetical protein